MPTDWVTAVTTTVVTTRMVVTTTIAGTILTTETKTTTTGGAGFPGLTRDKLLASLPKSEPRSNLKELGEAFACPVLMTE